jgi:histidine triad (HIT) family protein
VEKGCLFCEIAAGNINADVVYRDKTLFVLRDINPQAPVHLLVIPVGHYANLMEVSENADLMSALLFQCARQGFARGGDEGYRVVVNTGFNGGQTVNHLHFHVLAGRELQWPPG